MLAQRLEVARRAALLKLTLTIGIDGAQSFNVLYLRHFALEKKQRHIFFRGT